MSIPREEYETVARRAELLVPAEEIERAMDRMAAEISAELSGADPLILCVMTGAVVVVGRLLPRLGFPLRLDYLHATRYREATTGGELTWLHRPADAIRGQHVLVVDDILDEGITLDAAVRVCRDDGAASVRSAVLVEKDRPRTRPCEPDFVGVTVPDRYVYGYGLDYRGYFRNAAGIYAVASADLGRSDDSEVSTVGT
jgi:hypoxanthine phosphoribosyltransferase